MSQPLVYCVCLTRGTRPKMLERAIAAFHAQTYGNKFLYVLDTGGSSYTDETVPGVFQQGVPALKGQTIGALRNFANARPIGEIICHWDDDDWSHPNRIEEQVALLQASGKDAVGYRDMLFWMSPDVIVSREILDARIVQLPNSERGCVFKPFDVNENLAGEAWLYTSQQVERYVLGTSLCYWRKAWERVPFPDRMRGEDDGWQQCVATLGVTSGPMMTSLEPRMMASIHEGNQCRVIHPSKEWKRVTEWDHVVGERMAL